MHEAGPVAGDHRCTLQSTCPAQDDSLQLWLKTQQIRSVAETLDLRLKVMMERSLSFASPEGCVYPVLA